MYRLVDNPFENSTLKEELEAVIKAQERATAMGGFLVTEYDQHFLPQLDKLAGVKRSGYRSSRNDGLIYGWTCEFGEIKALPGAPYGAQSPSHSPAPNCQRPCWKVSCGRLARRCWITALAPSPSRMAILSSPFHL